MYLYIYIYKLQDVTLLSSFYVAIGRLTPSVKGFICILYSFCDGFLSIPRIQLKHMTKQSCKKKQVRSSDTFHVMIFLKGYIHTLLTRPAFLICEYRCRHHHHHPLVQQSTFETFLTADKAYGGYLLERICLGNIQSNLLKRDMDPRESRTIPWTRYHEIDVRAFFHDKFVMREIRKASEFEGATPRQNC